MNVTEYVKVWHVSIDEEDLKALKSLEVDCIMTDWKCALAMKPPGNSLCEGRTCLYIDLMNSKLEHYFIVQINNQQVGYMLTHSIMEDGFFKGNMIECIEFFRKCFLV